MRSTWQLNLEAFRFYRLKEEKFVKLSLLLILALQISARLAPIGDRNFFPFTYALESLGRLSPVDILGQLSPGNWLIIGLHAASALIASALSLMYMQIFVLEQTCYSQSGPRSKEDQALLDSIRAFRLQVQMLRSLSQSLNKDLKEGNSPDKSTLAGGYYWQESPPGTSDQDAGISEELPSEDAWTRGGFAEASQAEAFPGCQLADPQKETALGYTWRRFGQTLPRQLAFLLLLDLAYVFSIMLLGLPFYFYLSAFLLAPVLFMQGLSFREGMRTSYQGTKGVKLFIISNYFMVNLLFLLAEGLASFIFAQASYSLGIWQSLFFALRFLVFARFAGLMYLVVGESDQGVRVEMTKL